MLYKKITTNIFVERKRKSLNEEKVYYLKELVEEKKLRREETTKYRKKINVIERNKRNYTSQEMINVYTFNIYVTKVQIK